MTRRPRPADLVALAVERYGVDAVRDWCERLVLGEAPHPEETDPDIALLGGNPSWPDHWLRVWGMRAFRYLGPPAHRVLEHALRDGAWRVREHALAVVAESEAAEFLAAADAALDDPVPRVRAAAMRVVAALGEVEHAAHLRRMNPSGIGEDRVEAALIRMADRLDRQL